MALVVSIIGSLRDLNPAPLPVIVARTLSKSLVDLASRSSRVTNSTSPSSRACRARWSWRRSVAAPETFSLKTFSAPAALECGLLSVQGLPVSADPSVADYHFRSFLSIKGVIARTQPGGLASLRRAQTHAQVQF